MSTISGSCKKAIDNPNYFNRIEFSEYSAPEGADIRAFKTGPAGKQMNRYRQAVLDKRKYRKKA